MKNKLLLSTLLSIFLVSTASAQFADQRQYAPNSTGTANAQIVAIPNYALNVGVVIRFKASGTNTGATTLNVNGTGPVAVEKQTGNGLFPLVGAEIVAGQIVAVVYDGTQFEIISSPTQLGFGLPTAIASGATTDIGTLPSNSAIVTGSTTITSLGGSANLNSPFYLVQFNGGLTLTNSGSLALPGGSNLVVGSGDTILARYEGGTSWKIDAYFPAGAPAGTYPGEIRTFAMATCPANWQATDGSAISRTTFAGLFAAIGTTYGSGNGTTTFNVPDGRGYFARVWDNGAGRDPARTIGSTQALQVGAASGTITASSTFSSGTTTFTTILSGSSGALGYTTGTGTASASPVTGTVTTTGTASTNAGNTDNRPINIAYQNCIKE